MQYKPFRIRHKKTNLKRCWLRAHGGEAYNVREVDGAGVEGLRLHANALDKNYQYDK